MAHSSKLMTIDAMISYLASLKQKLASGKISATDFIDLFDVVKDIEDIGNSMRKFDLVVTVDEAQQAVCNLSIERRRTVGPSPDRPRATRVGFKESTWEMTLEDARTLSRALSATSFRTTIPGDL